MIFEEKLYFSIFFQQSFNNNKVYSFPCFYKDAIEQPTTTYKHTHNRQLKKLSFSFDEQKTVKFMLDALRGISCTFECTQNTIKYQKQQHKNEIVKTLHKKCLYLMNFFLINKTSQICCF